MSDVSTTVRNSSLHQNYKKVGGKIRSVAAHHRPSQSHNFAELGAGLMNDAPSSKRSI